MGSYLLRAGVVAGLGLTVLGQTYFATRREYLWDGVFFYAAGTALLVWSARRYRVDAPPEPPDADPEPPDRGIPAYRVILLAAGLLGLAGSLALVVTRQPAAAYWDALGLWVGGIVLTASACLERLAPPGRCTAVALGLALFGLGLRLYRLDSVPYVMDGDAAAHGFEAIRVLEGGISNPFTTGWGGLPTLFFFMQAATMSLFGVNAFGLRFMSAILGALSVPLMYLLGRELFGRWVGFLAATFLAVYALHIHFSRIGKNDVGDVFFVLLVLLCLQRGIRTAKVGWFGAAGIALGLSQYFYHGSRLIPVLAALYLGAAVVRRPELLRRLFPGLGLFALSALLVFAPLGHHFVTHPQDFMARLVIVGVFQSGWFEREVAAGRRPAEIMFTQVVRSFLGFNFFPDTAPHYRPGGPMLGFVPGILFVVGLGYAIARLGVPANLAVVGWFVLGVFVGNVLTVDPPYSPRLLVSVPAVCLLIALGLAQTGRLAAAAFEWLAQDIRVIQLAVVVAVAYAEASWYFWLFGEQKYHWDANTVLGTSVGEFIRGQGPGAWTYFLGAPRVYLGHPTIQWVAGRPRGEDIVKPLTSPSEVPERAERPLIFIGVPERVSEAPLVQSAYPGGRLSWLSDPNGRQQVAWAYVVEK